MHKQRSRPVLAAKPHLTWYQGRAVAIAPDEGYWQDHPEQWTAIVDWWMSLVGRRRPGVEDPEPLPTHPDLPANGWRLKLTRTPRY